MIWELLGCPRARKADQVKHCKCGQAHSCIQVCLSKVLQGVDDHQVCRVPCRETGDAHQCRDLTSSDVDGGSGHESGKGHQGYQFHNPSAADQTNKEYYSTGYKSERTCNNPRRVLILRKLFYSIRDDSPSNSGYDSNRLRRVSKESSLNVQSVSTYSDSNIL